MGRRGSWTRNHGEEFEGTFTVVRETGMAMQLWDGEGLSTDAPWVPKSQITQVNKTSVKDQVNVTMSEWIAKEKGFI